MSRFLLTAALVATLSFADCVESKKLNKVLYCYYGTWATYRVGDGKFSVSNIDPNICTHIAYTFAGINGDGTVKILDPWLDLSPENGGGLDNFAQFVALKEQNPELKTTLSIGGWNQGSANFSKVVNDPELRKVFVKNATDTILSYGFDGLELDWEYPNRRDTVYGIADINGFSQLLRELRKVFDKHGLLLVAAVSAVESAAKLSYDIKAISKSLDLVNVMTYDLYTYADNVTGYNSALYKGLGDEHVSRKDALTVDAAIEYWLSEGCPPEKILLGVPLYGHTFTLANASDNGLRAPVIGPGVAGPYTGEAGMIGYNEFCIELQTNASWVKHYDNRAKVPYAVKGTEWVSYDDPASVELKAKYAVKKGLRGVMVWSIETDDFHGLCHGEKFPLLNTINRVLGTNNDDSSSTTTTTTKRPTTVKPKPTPPSPTPPSNPKVCSMEGLNKNPYSCTSFYNCVKDQYGNFIPYLFQCPSDLYWDQKAEICNYRDLVRCDAYENENYLL